MRQTSLCLLLTQLSLFLVNGISPIESLLNLFSVLSVDSHLSILGLSFSLLIECLERSQSKLMSPFFQRKLIFSFTFSYLLFLLEKFDTFSVLQLYLVLSSEAIQICQFSNLWIYSSRSLQGMILFFNSCFFSLEMMGLSF